MEKVKEREVLINRSQMLEIAKEHRLFVSLGTIHRWANEPNFPLVVGKEGKHLLYSQSDFSKFLNQRLRKLQDEH